MTVPPRLVRRAGARTAPDSTPLEREEIEALVEALIEEARESSVVAIADTGCRSARCPVGAVIRSSSTVTRHRRPRRQRPPHGRAPPAGRRVRRSRSWRRRRPASGGRLRGALRHEPRREREAEAGTTLLDKPLRSIPPGLVTRPAQAPLRAHVSRSAAPCASYCGKEIFVMTRTERVAAADADAVADSDPAWFRMGRRSSGAAATARGGRLRDECRWQRSAEPDVEAGRPGWAALVAERAGDPVHGSVPYAALPGF